MKMMKLFVGEKSKQHQRYPFFEQKILTLLLFSPQSPQAIASQLNLSFIDTFTVLRSLEATKQIKFTPDKRVSPYQAESVNRATLQQGSPNAIASEVVIGLISNAQYLSQSQMKAVFEAIQPHWRMEDLSEQALADLIEKFQRMLNGRHHPASPLLT